MDRLPFWDGAFDAVHRHQRIYRIGDLRVWPGPWPIYPIKIGLAVFAPVLILGVTLGVPIDPLSQITWLWYVGIPAAAAVLSRQQIDGRYPHHAAAAWAVQRIHTIGSRDYRRRRAARTVRVSGRVWSRHRI